MPTDDDVNRELAATPVLRRDLGARVLDGDQPTDQLGARTMRGGAIGVTAQIIRMALQIISVSVLARLLLPEHFGLIAMGGTVTAFIGAFTDLNASLATIQSKKLDQDQVSGIFFVTMATSLITLLIGVASMPLAAYLLKDERIKTIVLGLALSAPISALGAQHSALLTRNMRWIQLHFTLITGLACGIVAAILAAWLFHVGYWALIIQTWVTAAVTTILAWIVCPWRPSWVRDWSGARRSVKMGIHLTGSSVLAYFGRQFDNVLIGWRWGAVELGFYGRAYTLLQTPLGFLTGPLSSALVPVMSQLQHDPDKWRKAYLDALAVLTFVGGAMACLLYGGAKPIIRIVLGPGWGETVVIFSNLVLAMLVATPMRTTGWIYLSLGRTDRLLQWALVSTPVYVLSFIIGLPFGAKGVALGFSLSQMLAFFPCMWMATRGTNITMPDILTTVAAPMAATIAVALGLSAVVAHLGLLAQVAAIAAAGLVYAALSALIIWRLPQYARLRTRAINLLRLGATHLSRLRTRQA